MIPKFRAYCKSDKTIYEVLLIDFKAKIEQIQLRHAVNNWYDFEEIVLMQSTGLHDKNGVEIFEGDVVEIIYDGESFTGVVVYDLGETDFKATNNHEDYGNNFQYLTVGESIKVIGNIYQNKELLGE